MILPIITLQNPGAAVLRRRARPITTFDEELRVLADSMIETAKANYGIGIAAPQVDVAKRIFVFATQPDLGTASEFLVAINPKFLFADTKYEDMEGCLSIPGYLGKVERYRDIKVEYQDLTGRFQEAALSGLCARLFQHESDHLSGILFIDRLVTENGQIQLFKSTQLNLSDCKTD